MKDGGGKGYDELWAKALDRVWGGGGKTSDGVKGVRGNELLEEV